MKRYLLFFCLAITTIGFSQDKVVWNVSYNAKAGQIELKASISDGWHLYSQFISNDAGPVPTTFVFHEGTTVKFDGKVTEPEAIHAYDENFEASLDFFKDQVIFIQKIVPASKGVVSGYVTYMVCSDIMCLPPVDYEFSIAVP